MKISDLEKRIEKEYSYKSVREITSKGIVLNDCELLFDDLKIPYHGNKDYMGRDFVADRNVLTTPKYLKFISGEIVYIITFPTIKDLYLMVDRLLEVGYSTFDVT